MRQSRRESLGGAIDESTQAVFIHGQGGAGRGLRRFLARASGARADSGRRAAKLPIPQSKPSLVTPLDARDATAPPIRPLRAPEGAPNVVIVLIDDMGFGASSAYGGPCDMPIAERLAMNGLKYTRFHTTALCSPTRQALLTGRNHHSVNMAGISELATGFPGYTSVRPDSAATIAQTLKLNGYNTAAFGKMHQTPVWETSASGPFDRWPSGDGFERFYGFLGGETNQWYPTLFEGISPAEPPDDPRLPFQRGHDVRAIAYMREQKAMTPDKPFFAYVAYGACHAPLQAPKPYIEKYRGKFEQGWDRQREETFARQKQLGVIPEDARLTERPREIPAWDSLSVDEKRVASRLMETYAGFAEHTDAEVGRIVDALRKWARWITPSFSTSSGITGRAPRADRTARSMKSRR